MTKIKSENYFELVYEITRQIPKGRVSTYGAIADFLSLGSARMVGWALNHCHGEMDVPAHRVVNRKGELSGRVHFKPPSAMAMRLRKEGVKVVKDEVVEFEELFWHPKELELL